LWGCEGGGGVGGGVVGFQVARDVPVTTLGPGFLLSLGLYNAAQSLLAKQTPFGCHICDEPGPECARSHPMVSRS